MPTNFPIEGFKAALSGGGARPNLFKAILTFPFNSDVVRSSFLCKAASLPGSTVAPIPLNFRGRTMNVAGDRTFEPWSVTIVNDTDFTLRNDFERWMNQLNQHVTNLSMPLPAVYKTDMEVIQLGKDGSELKGYNFIGVFPSSISPIDLGYDNSGAVEEFTVELQVDYWISNTTT